MAIASLSIDTPVFTTPPVATISSHAISRIRNIFYPSVGYYRSAMISICFTSYEMSVARLTFTVKSFGTHGKPSTDSVRKHTGAFQLRGWYETWPLLNTTIRFVCKRIESVFFACSTLHLSYHTGLKTVQHCSGGLCHQMMVLHHYSCFSFKPFNWAICLI